MKREWRKEKIRKTSGARFNALQPQGDSRGTRSDRFHQRKGIHQCLKMDFPILQILNLIKKDIRGSCLIISPTDLTKTFQEMFKSQAIVQRVIN